MPALANPQHELFARALAAGGTLGDAAIAAGYKPTSAPNTGHRLMQREDVAARVAELQQDVCEKYDVTADRVIKEIARIAFGDPRRVMSWAGTRVERDQKSAGDGALALKPGHLTLTDSDDLTDDDVAMVAEVKVTKEGMSLKLHDKLAALEKLARFTGVYDREAEKASDALARLIASVQGTALPIAGTRRAGGGE